MLPKFNAYIKILLESSKLIGLLGKTNDDWGVVYAFVYDKDQGEATHAEYLFRNARGDTSGLKGRFHWRYAIKSQTLFYWDRAWEGSQLEMMEITKSFLENKGYPVKKIRKITSMTAKDTSYVDSHLFR